jgi:hypothetical protein
MITLLGLFGWISSMLVFIFKVFPGRDCFESKPARTWGIAILVSYAVWVVGMLNA